MRSTRFGRLSASPPAGAGARLNEEGVDHADVRMGDGTNLAVTPPGGTQRRAGFTHLPGAECLGYVELGTFQQHLNSRG